MVRSPQRQEPAGYRLRVDGHLDDHWSPWFGGLTLTHEDDGTTSLSGFVLDQAQLHGLLAKIRDLGITLICVEAIEPATPESPGQGWPLTADAVRGQRLLGRYAGWVPGWSGQGRP